MSFLFPWALALAALAAVPLLLHLLRRDVAQRIPFPALRYLRRAERRTARSMRLRDQILLLVRILLVVLIALAAAHPLVGLGGARDHEPTDVLVLIDNTASTGRVAGDHTLLDAQIAAAREALASAGPEDRFWVAPVVGRVLLAGAPAGEALKVLDRVEPTDAGGDFVERLAELTTAVPVREGRVREAFVFTDGQLPERDREALDLGAWGPLLLSAASSAAEANGSVLGLRLEPSGPIVPGDPSSIAARLGEGASGDTVDVRLVVDGQTRSMARAPWNSEAVLALPDLGPGAHVIRVETPPSGLRSDDARQIGVVAADVPVIRLAGDGPGFVERAIHTLAAADRLRVASPGERPTVVVSEGAGVDPGAGDAALVLFPPVDLTDLPAFQQRLAASGIPWQISVSGASGEVPLSADGGVAGLEGVRLARAFTLEREPSPATGVDSVLLRTGEGRPWLVRGAAEGRVFLLAGSPMDAEASNLPTGVAMIPFMENTLLRWGRPGAEPTWEVDAGTTLGLPDRAEAIVAPHGDTTRVEGGAPWTPLKAGAWRVIQAEGAARASILIGVNVPASESHLAAADGERLASLLPDTRIRLVSGASEWRDAAFTARRGAHATPWILGAIMLLILADLLLAAPERRQVAPAG